MKAPKLLFLGIALALLAMATAAAIAQEQAPSNNGGCSATSGYDPACDVNHDGHIDLVDIQLTAGHWGDSGIWMGDNQHNHLGQNWVGDNNSLVFSGSFAGPDYAPLVLSNSYGLGHGLHVESVGLNGVDVYTAGEDGFYVHSTGGMDTTTQSSDANGFEVAGAGGYGLFVGRAGQSGVEVNWADNDGLRVVDATDDALQIGGGVAFPTYGLFIPDPGTDQAALIVNTANSLGEWALITPDKIQAQNVTIESYSLLAVVAAGETLEVGDVVSAVGLANPLPGGRSGLSQVRAASPEWSGVVGVVESRMAFQPAPGKEGVEILHSVTGPAGAGEYVAITVLGVAQVKIDSAGAVQAGQSLTAADTPGLARTLRTVEVEGVALVEGGPVIGVALEDSGTGTQGSPGGDEAELIWALVNVR